MDGLTRSLILPLDTILSTTTSTDDNQPIDIQCQLYMPSIIEDIHTTISTQFIEPKTNNNTNSNSNANNTNRNDKNNNNSNNNHQNDTQFSRDKQKKTANLSYHLTSPSKMNIAMTLHNNPTSPLLYLTHNHDQQQQTIQQQQQDYCGSILTFMLSSHNHEQCEEEVDSHDHSKHIRNGNTNNNNNNQTNNGSKNLAEWHDFQFMVDR